ncbi:MAG: enoyl-CoA hydratase/isomerase family protein [Pseudomonadota bacterium]
MAVHTTQVDGVIHVELARPPANAMVPEFLEEIANCFEGLGRNEDVRAIVLKGNGRVFSAGMDLKAAADVTDTAASDALVQSFNLAFAAVYGCPKPVIGALNGHAIAGGMVLALCCDYRVAPNANALFGLTEVRVGVPFPEVAYNVIADQLRPDALRRLIQFGENIDPQLALEWGAVDEIADLDHVVQRAHEKASECLEIPARGYREVKLQLRGATMAQNAELVTTKSDKYLGRWLDDAARQAAINVLKG